jgi:hypothetical protein
MASSAPSPGELLSDLAHLRRRTRTARHAYWFPLVVFGLLTCASAPLYISAVSYPHPGDAAALTVVLPAPTLLGGEQLGLNGLYLGWYWVIALVAGYLATLFWYRRHGRRAGVQTPARGFVITGITLACLAFLGPLLAVELPFRSWQALMPAGDLWIRGTFAFLIAAVGLWVLAWAERSRALAVIALAYTGSALLSSLYNVVNILYWLGWNPRWDSFSARLSALPNVLLPALVLLAGGAGAFFLRPRPGRE